MNLEHPELLARRRGLKMRGWKLAAAVVIVAAATTIVVWIVTQVPREPTYQGKTAHQWLDQYASSETVDKDEALRALLAMRDDAGPYLVSLLLNGRSDFWRDNYRKAAKALPSSMSKRLQTGDNIPKALVEVLMQLKPKASGIVPLLQAPLSNPHHPQYIPAIWVLGTLGEGGEEAVPYLVSACTSTNNKTRRLAVQSLELLGFRARGAEEALMNALQDHLTRGRAIRALGNLGLNARAARVHLEPFLQETNGTIRLETAAALYQITGESEFLDLILMGLQRRDNPALQEQAINALGTMGTNARPALGVMVKTLRDDPGTGAAFRSHSLLACIWRTDSGNRAVIPILLEKVKTDNRDVRLNLAAWLVRFDPSEPKGLGIVSEFLMGDREPTRRIFCADLLREAGQGAAAALPAIRAATKDPDRDVRKAAQAALRAVEGKSDAKRENRE